MKKKKDVFILFIGSSLLIMPIKQLLISTDHGMKNPLVMETYGTGF